MVRKKKRAYKRKTKSYNYKEREYNFFALNGLKIALFVIFAIYYLLFAFSSISTQSTDYLLGNFVFVLLGWPILIMNNYLGLIVGLIWIYIFSCILDYLKHIVKR